MRQDEPRVIAAALPGHTRVAAVLDPQTHVIQVFRKRRQRHMYFEAATPEDAEHDALSVG